MDRQVLATALACVVPVLGGEKISVSIVRRASVPQTYTMTIPGSSTTNVSGTSIVRILRALQAAAATRLRSKPTGQLGQSSGKRQQQDWCCSCQTVESQSLRALIRVF